MKKLLALSFAAVILSSAAFAQKERTVENKARMERHEGRHDKDKMMKELNLTKEQRTQLKAQHQDMKAKRKALKAQDNITVKEMREKQAALKLEQKGKMDAVLTADQRTKMADLKKQKMAERGERKMKRNKK
jgi:Spy/CpxP family protein refolding chaperone